MIRSIQTKLWILAIGTAFASSCFAMDPRQAPPEKGKAIESVYTMHSRPAGSDTDPCVSVTQTVLGATSTNGNGAVEPGYSYAISTGAKCQPDSRKFDPDLIPLSLQTEG